jgi:osmotically inducible protein OsmC
MIGKATAQWTGGLKTGKGSMKPANAPEAAFTLASRFEGQASSSPEELIGAALAGCYSMALTAALEKAGVKPTKVSTQAQVTLDKVGDGFAITSIQLTCAATAAGIDAGKFAQVADETKKTCPVSKALAGTKILLDAKLA